MPIHAPMGKWGKNCVVAGVALGCMVILMGVVRLDDGFRGAPAMPERGWDPDATTGLRAPVEVAPRDSSRDEGR